MHLGSLIVNLCISLWFSARFFSVNSAVKNFTAENAEVFAESRGVCVSSIMFEMLMCISLKRKSSIVFSIHKKMSFIY